MIDVIVLLIVYWLSYNIGYVIDCFIDCFIFLLIVFVSFFVTNCFIYIDLLFVLANDNLFMGTLPYFPKKVAQQIVPQVLRPYSLIPQLSDCQNYVPEYPLY